MALLVDAMALSVDTMALLVDTMALLVDAMALLADAIALLADAIALPEVGLKWHSNTNTKQQERTCAIRNCHNEYLNKPIF
ncbi:MAG: hypothetical protein V7K68_29495 [Nostoc sp.]|uniref:hypothetical protein n=1 Tax=Nostoc sp. TaxID=1180 RepID=UPI002FF71FF9